MSHPVTLDDIVTPAMVIGKDDRVGIDFLEVFASATRTRCISFIG